MRLTREAQDDLERPFDFILARELQKPGGDVELAEQARSAIRASAATLKSSPFTCGKAGKSPFLSEPIVPFARAGHVALFEIVDPTEVVVSAVRH